MHNMKTLLGFSSVAASVLGIALVVGGVGGIYFTYQNIARENIVTPSDADFPEQPVRGPLTLKAQADIIRKHTLEMTGGKTYAEMPRQVPKLDENGAQILDAEGKPVMTANTARDIWALATTLTTALHLGILAYAFSGLLVLFGLVLLWAGVVLNALGKRALL